jgi:hypothetical protein
LTCNPLASIVALLMGHASVNHALRTSNDAHSTFRREDGVDFTSISPDTPLRHRRQPTCTSEDGLRCLRPIGSLSRWARVLLILLSLAVLLIQVCHPALHPHEVIDPGAAGHQVCPLSHVVAALLCALIFLPGAELALSRPHDPLPWLGRTCFILGLAPRPPPM